MCRSGPWCQMRARTSLSDAFADESEVLKKGELPVNRGWCRVEGGAKVVEGDLLVDRVEGRGREEGSDCPGEVGMGPAPGGDFEKGDDLRCRGPRGGGRGDLSEAFKDLDEGVGETEGEVLPDSVDSK